ncbi:ankyrin repeat-containing domain protein [Rhexocercosporidium sp. MPI-PUGE-AT-0058]|nr:ankyrin repeat-containing domain protein [Rhexocercosporidium sp. MPI-PUGE-AT-0058]
MTTLESALSDQDIGLVKEFLRSSSPPSQRELDIALALAVDLELGPHDAVAPLFEACALITKEVLVEAACREDVDLYQTMLNYGWDINSVELAVGGESHVKWFLDHGADPNLTGKYASPLGTAALEPLSGVLEIPISHGAELDPYALFKAMSPRGKGGIPVMTYLIDHGIDINAVRPEYGTPLHYAVNLGITAKERLELLLQRGADRTVQKSSGLTPAELAEKKGYMDVLEILLG